MRCTVSTGVRREGAHRGTAWPRVVLGHASAGGSEPAVDCGFEDREAERLGQVVVHAGGEAAFAVAIYRVGGEELMGARQAPRSRRQRISAAVS